MSFRSGFVCILGRPNAGKSTLLNKLVGQKLAIISPKPQTTRNRILGIVHIPRKKGRPAAQVILVDTPGVHKPDSSLGRKMMGDVREAMQGCNLVLWMVDATRKHSADDQIVLDILRKAQTPVFLLLNKIDLLREKGKLLPVIEAYRSLYPFKEVIPMSALKGEGLNLLLDKLIETLLEGPHYFPDDQVTDQPIRFMVAEAIREQVLMATSEEVPHATTVLIEQFEEGAKLARIAAAIYCEREGQKRILVGKGSQIIGPMSTDLTTCNFEAGKLILKLRVTLAADKNAIDPVVRGVMDLVKQTQCATGKEDAIEMALTEALANAVVHGAKADPTKIVECDVACDEKQQILIVVRDPGQGFDPAAIPCPVQGQNIYSEHGRGIFLINELMDEVKFLKNGTEIHMIK